MANALLVLGLLFALWLYCECMPQKIKQKMIRDEVRRGLKDGSIKK